MSSMLFWLTVHRAPFNQEHYVTQTTKVCLTLGRKQVPAHPKMEPTMHVMTRTTYIMVAAPVA